MAGKVKLTEKWPRHFRTFWCVVDGHGTAFLVSARINRRESVVAFLEDADKTTSRDWSWWRRIGYSCQCVDIKVRSALLASNTGKGD